MAKIIIDAGHGGSDVGDIYDNRYEKDDNLKLALMVGEILQNKYHFDVAYTRTTDTYLSQLDRVEIVNSVRGDLLLSIHRIFGEITSNIPSLSFYIYNNDNVSEAVTNNTGMYLAEVGFPYYSVNIRTELPIFSQSNMPAVMISVGNLSSDLDNMVFDTQLTAIAEAIAKGVSMSFSEEQETIANLKSRMTETEYSIRVGEHSGYENASNQQLALVIQGYPARITRELGGYVVLVGKYNNLETAVKLERILRQEGYATMILA